MPRMLPRHKYADYMVVSAGYAEQDLATSHNMIGSVRPKLTYSIFPIWDDNARGQFEFAPGH